MTLTGTERQVKCALTKRSVLRGMVWIADFAGLHSEGMVFNQTLGKSAMGNSLINGAHKTILDIRYKPTYGISQMLHLENPRCFLTFKTTF